MFVLTYHLDRAYLFVLTYHLDRAYLFVLTYHLDRAYLFVLTYHLDRAYLFFCFFLGAERGWERGEGAGVFPFSHGKENWTINTTFSLRFALENGDVRSRVLPARVC